MRRSQHQSPPNQQDHLRQIFHELSSIVGNIMPAPEPPRSFDSAPSPIYRRRRSAPSFQSITPSGFASLLLGMSLALMLCGSVTFFIGLMLIPWVLPLAVFSYFVGIASCIPMIGKALFSYATSGPTTPRQHVPLWKLL